MPKCLNMPETEPTIISLVTYVGGILNPSKHLKWLTNILNKRLFDGFRNVDPKISFLKIYL